MNYSVTRWVCCFDKATGELRRELRLETIPLERLQDIFGVRRDDLMYEVWDIYPRHVARLQPFVRERIDVEAYDCSLHCYRES